MGRPMMPSPMKPTFMILLLVLDLLRARFESVRALRSPLHIPPVRYFCHCRTHELCCKLASMHVELSLSPYLHWRYPARQGRCTCPSGDLSKRALRDRVKAGVKAKREKTNGVWGRRNVTADIQTKIQKLIKQGISI